MTRKQAPQTLAEAEQANHEMARRRERAYRAESFLATVAGLVVVTIVGAWFDLRCQSLDIKDAGMASVTPWQSAPEVLQFCISSDTLLIGRLVASSPRTPSAITFVLEQGQAATPVGGALGGLFGITDLGKTRVLLTAPHTLIITLPADYQPTSKTVQARLGGNEWSVSYLVGSD
jgi:hypothetical protein